MLLRLAVLQMAEQSVVRFEFRTRCPDAFVHIRLVDRDEIIRGRWAEADFELDLF